MRSRDTRNALAYRPPWLILFTGYLCINGLFGTLYIVLKLPTQYNLLWHIRRYFLADYDWTAPWAWTDPSRYLWLCLTEVVTLAAGLLLWMHPTRVKRVALTVAIALIVGATLNSLTSLGEWLTRGSLYPGWAVKSSVVLRDLAAYAVPALALWFVHRADTLRRPAITLIAGYLLVVGAAGTMAHIVLLFAEGDQGYPQMLRDSGWPTISPDLLFLVWQLGRFVTVAMFFVCGLLLLKRPARIVAVAWASLAATFVHPSVAVLLLATDQLKLGSGFLSTLSFFSGDAGVIAMALFVLLFAYRLRDRSRDKFPECRICGYNLTGNVSGTCPECGEAT